MVQKRSINDEISLPRKIQSAANAATHATRITSRITIRRMDLRLSRVSVQICARSGSRFSRVEPTHCGVPRHSKALLRLAQGLAVFGGRKPSFCELHAEAGVR